MAYSASTGRIFSRHVHDIHRYFLNRVRKVRLRTEVSHPSCPTTRTLQPGDSPSITRSAGRRFCLCISSVQGAPSPSPVVKVVCQSVSPDGDCGLNPEMEDGGVSWAWEGPSLGFHSTGTGGGGVSATEKSLPPNSHPVSGGVMWWVLEPGAGTKVQDSQMGWSSLCCRGGGAKYL